jgi:hypothetical protein
VTCLRFSLLLDCHDKDVLTTMPTIRIDDEVWKALQQHATPFVDSPNDVLRKLLGLSGLTPKASSAATSNLQKGSDVMITSQREYREPIRCVLQSLGGAGHADDVLKKVEAQMRATLNQADYELMPNSAEPRWRLQARFERKNMELDGIIKKSTKRGWWELN